MEILCACHTSVVAVFETFLSIPEAEYHHLTLPVYTQLAQGFAAMTLLTSFEHDEWNISHIPEPMRLCNILGSIADKFDSAVAKLQIDEDEPGEIHIYAVNAKKFRVVQEFYRTKILAKHNGELSLNAQNSTDRVASDGASHEPVLDTVDESWLNDWPAPWDYDDILL